MEWKHSDRFLQWLERTYTNAWRRWQLHPRNGKISAFEARYAIPKKFRAEVTKYYEYRSAQKFSRDDYVNFIVIDPEGTVFVHSRQLYETLLRPSFRRQWSIHRLRRNTSSDDERLLKLIQTGRSTIGTYWQYSARIAYERITGFPAGKSWPFSVRSIP